MNALGRISQYVDLKKRKLLMNAFFNSQFNYCPLTWMGCSRVSNNHINRLHEKCLRIIYNDKSSSFNELLLKDGPKLSSKYFWRYALSLCKVSLHDHLKFPGYAKTIEKNEYTMVWQRRHHAEGEHDIPKVFTSFCSQLDFVQWVKFSDHRLCAWRS